MGCILVIVMLRFYVDRWDLLRGKIFKTFEYTDVHTSILKYLVSDCQKPKYHNMQKSFCDLFETIAKLEYIFIMS